MKNALKMLNNYLEQAMKDGRNVVDALGHIFAEKALFKRKGEVETQIQASGFRVKKSLETFNFGFQPSIDKRQIGALAAMRVGGEQTEIGVRVDDVAAIFRP